ncbi:MAG: alpha-galactosidase [Ruminococcaceae bacterium]|nr:alpha-galactosidase [Oscillospiraceae bacterium]
MAIIFDSEKQVFKLDTPNSSYVMRVSGAGYLLHLYYGAYVPDLDLDYLRPTAANASFSAVVASPKDPWMSLDTTTVEYAAEGTGDFRSTALSIRGEDGNSATDIRYASHKIYAGKPAIPGLPATYTNTDDEADTLEITMRDELTGAEVVLIYTAFTKLDVITRSVRVTNTGKAAFDIERLHSTCVDMNGMDFELLHLQGRWAKERTLVKRHLEFGLQGIHSKRGSSSHNNNPFIALARDGYTEETGEVYGFSFVYSSNFAAEVEVDCFRTTRVLMGINPETFGWHLEAGETFHAPEVAMVYSRDGVGGMSRTYHKLYRYNLCRGEWKTKKRPILVNNWEGTYFDFDADKLVAIASDAADLGIEMLVMDDGWFGVRNNDNCSLGDWYVNESKLEGGLSKLVERVNALGLKFGIWFEPEMVSPDSDLYRAHPDWCLHVDGRERSLGRRQLVLDMSRADVRDNIYNQMHAILSSANIEYVKWDFNRNLTEVGSAILPPERQKEVAHRYILGVYELMERLLTAFPKLLLEGCSGGGGRFDPGMLYYSPQIWTSDDTDAMERLEIQYGTSIVYPPSTMSAHVSASPNHQTRRSSSFKTRGDVAMAGAFGYELDLTTLTDEERTLVREQVANYHKYYDLIQNGDYYRLVNPTESKGTMDSAAAWESVSADKNEALLTYVVNRTAVNVTHYIRMRGLDPEKIYVEEGTGRKYSGALLMNAGLKLGGGWKDAESRVWHFIAE